MAQDSAVFDGYLREVLAHLTHLPPHQREEIAAELYTHLEELALEHGSSPADRAVQLELINRLGPSHEVGSNFGVAYQPARPTWWRTMLDKIAQLKVALIVALIGILFAIAAQSVVPPVNETTVVRVQGSFQQLEDSCCGDVVIKLNEYSDPFVVNSDLSPVLNIRELRALPTGTPLELTVYRDTTAIETDHGYTPQIVQIRTNNQILLDQNDVAPARAYSRPVFAGMSLLAGCVCLVLVGLHLSRQWFGSRTRQFV
jgi:hypothetical protein